MLRCPSLRGSIIQLLATLILMSFAHADHWTGSMQPVSSMAGDCSQVVPNPAPEPGPLQISSDFQYLACKEYRSSADKSLVYRLEYVSDGEYIHLLPGPRQTSVTADDYRLTSMSVQQICENIRRLVLQRMISIEKTPCANTTLQP